MARPRKDAQDPCARQRLIDAFWALLETRPVHEITVGALVEVAGCNRGTFYYYFADVDALVAFAAEELLGDGSLSLAVFRCLVAGSPASVMHEVAPERIAHAALLMRSGELQTIEVALRRAVQGLWQGRLCGAGEELSPTACFAIQFMVGGMLGYIIWSSRLEQPFRPLPRVERVYLAQVARATVETVARAQGMTPVEVVARLTAEDALAAGRPQPSCASARQNG